jgi:hypothetical protein
MTLAAALSQDAMSADFEGLGKLLGRVERHASCAMCAAGLRSDLAAALALRARRGRKRRPERALTPTLAARVAHGREGVPTLGADERTLPTATRRTNLRQ